MSQAGTWFSLNIAFGLASQLRLKILCLVAAARVQSSQPTDHEESEASFSIKYCFGLQKRNIMHRRLWAIVLLASLTVAGAAGARVATSPEGIQ